MSQFRTRATSAVRKSVAKVSGEYRNERKSSSRDKGKSSIPKNVRYELESALLGLCDVWFEDIKPHLINNNIKLHVHGREDAGDCARGTPPCLHRDPGPHSHVQPLSNARSVGCCSAPQPASTAPCRRPPARPSQDPPQETKQTRSNSSSKPPPARRKRRPPAPSMHVVPRLCRPYQLSPAAAAADRTPATSPTPKREVPSLYGITEISVTKSNRNFIKMNKSSARTRKNTSMSSLKQKVKAPPNTKRRSGSQSTTRSGSTMKTQPKRPRHKSSNKRPKKKREKKDAAQLFPDDLIDMIGSAQEQRLIMLYESPKEEYSLGLHQNKDCEPKRYKPLYIRRLPWR